MTANPPHPNIPSDAVTLESGRMPLLGFGTWQLKGEAATTAVTAALEAGYRHLDTATVYGNEGEVGRGLRDSGVPREDVFLTTKCPPHQVGKERETLQRSLELLGTDHVDLWLVHWPAQGDDDVRLWKALVEARAAGLARDIGVSNFGVDLIDRLAAETGATPAVNQIEWSPLLFDRAVLEEHRARKVAVEGYSALRGGTLDHPTIRDIAERRERTPAQVIVRWHVQHGVVVIPKSGDPERIRANADVAGFFLSDDEMATLDALGG